MRFVKTYNDFKLDCKLELKPGTITALIGMDITILEREGV